MKDTKELGFMIPEILVPAEEINLKKWSCVACDQFTSQPEYWKDVEKQVGQAASTLRIMLPEVYLEADNVDERISGMKQVMQDYVEQGVLEALPQGIMLVERHIGNKVRKGILLAMDLERYDYDIAKKPMIRATEETVLARIPARVRIRDGACVEMPHIMLLIDDEEDAVIGGLHMQRDSLKKIYDFDLMKGAGRSEGWLADGEKQMGETAEAISRLKRRDNMLYCVGDGNQSLATAKTIWDDAKKRTERRGTGEPSVALRAVRNHQFARPRGGIYAHTPDDIQREPRGLRAVCGGKIERKGQGGIPCVRPVEPFHAGGGRRVCGTFPVQRRRGQNTGQKPAAPIGGGRGAGYLRGVCGGDEGQQHRLYPRR